MHSKPLRFFQCGLAAAAVVAAVAAAAQPTGTPKGMRAAPMSDADPSKEQRSDGSHRHARPAPQ